MNARTLRAWVAAAGSLALLAISASAQTTVPQQLSYEGRLLVGTTNFNGSGQFKFAFVSGDGSVTYWSNDGTSTAGSEPTTAVPLNVTNGLYQVQLGDTTQTNMTALPASVFAATSSIYLRVWFDDGTHGSQQLSPDQQIASVAYAMIASTVANGAIGNTQLAPNLTLGGSTTISANLNLPITTSAFSGVLYLGGTPFLNAYGPDGLSDGNTFVGSSAGNFTMSGVYNTAVGQNALYANTMGFENAAFGSQALSSNTRGNNNSAFGAFALFANTVGDYNSAFGYQALYANTTGTYDTAAGFGALNQNTAGYLNTASGFEALNQNTTASANVAVGAYALYVQSFSNSGGTWNSNNVAVGNSALLNNSPTAINNGINNTAVGTQALYSNTTGSNTTAVGYQALYNSTASGDSAFGAGALYANTSGVYNTAMGQNALNANTVGFENAAFGSQALNSNTTGNNNSAFGAFALYTNSGGDYDSAFGYQALYANTSGSYDTATGFGAMSQNTTGNLNTAAGFEALNQNTTASANVAVGAYALYVQSFSNSGGTWNSNNVAVGDSALFGNSPTAINNGNNNTAVGTQALYVNSTGATNIALGYLAGSNLTTGSNNIDIFDPGVAGEGNTIRIGTQGTQTKTIVAGISGVTISSGSPVSVSSTGQLGTTTSSRRFKTDIAAMGDASSVLFALRPVSFHYKPEIDPKGLAQFGLIAEEVNEVNPDLVVRDEHGAIQSVRYEQINAMLLNEFLKEHRHAAEKDAEIRQLKDRLAELEARDKEREARLRKIEQLLSTTATKED